MRPNFMNLSTEQIQLAVALAAQLVRFQTPAAHTMDGIATCPHCHKSGPIEADFGTRVVRGTTYPQSWCRICRAIPKNQR